MRQQNQTSMVAPRRFSPLCLIGCKVDMFDLKVEAVNTHRDRPIVSFELLFFTLGVLVERPLWVGGELLPQARGLVHDWWEEGVRWTGGLFWLQLWCGVVSDHRGEDRAGQEWQVCSYRPIYGATPTCDHEVVTGTNWWGGRSGEAFAFTQSFQPMWM